MRKDLEMDDSPSVFINGIRYIPARSPLDDPTDQELAACISQMAAALPASQVLGYFLKQRREKLVK